MPHPLLSTAVTALILIAACKAEAKRSYAYTRTLGPESELPLNHRHLSDAGVPTADDAHIDEGWSILKAGMKGDQLSVFRELTSFAKLENLWAVPEYTKTLVDSMPILRGLKGIDALVQKNQQTGKWTSEDGLEALSAFKLYLSKSADVISTLQDPFSYAKKMEEWDATEDPRMLHLYSEFEKGNQEAAEELVQVFADRELGGIIDLKKFGLGGIEPQAIIDIRTKVLGDHPEIFDMMHAGDSIVEKYMRDPTIAMKEAKELMAGRV